MGKEKLANTSTSKTYDLWWRGFPSAMKCKDSQAKAYR